MVTLQKQTVKLKEDKERAERALHEMRVRHNEAEAGAQVGNVIVLIFPPLNDTYPSLVPFLVHIFLFAVLSSLTSVRV